MTHLQKCPNCGHAAKQRGNTRSFVTCGGTCPVSRLSIPVAAWQSWPRSDTASMPIETAEERLQRLQEITRLQNRLQEFGDIEQQHRKLQLQVERAQVELRAEQRQAKTYKDEQYRLEQGLKKMTTEHDKLTLQHNKIIQWAIGGAQIAWAAGDDQRAVVFEAALEQLGKRNAQKVPCLGCGNFPAAVSRISKTAGNLACGCRDADGKVRYYTAEQWCQKRRDDLKARREKQPVQTNTDAYLRNIATGRKFAASAGPGPAAAVLQLQADQNELLVQLVGQAKKQA